MKQKVDCPINIQLSKPSKVKCHHNYGTSAFSNIATGVWLRKKNHHYRKNSRDYQNDMK